MGIKKKVAIASRAAFGATKKVISVKTNLTFREDDKVRF